MPTGDVYVTSIEEIVWGGALIALTILIHSFGVILTLLAGGALRQRPDSSRVVAIALARLVSAAWLLALVHLAEVLLWAQFYSLQGAFPSLSVSYFYALMQYTTVGSDYTLPTSLRLVGGINAMAGLMTFAWSTGVLFMLAQEFQRKSFETLAEHTAQPSRR